MIDKNGLSNISAGAFGWPDRALMDAVTISTNELSTLPEDPFKELLSFMYENARGKFLVRFFFFTRY